MILDKNGTPMRRAIGFGVVLVREEKPKSDISVHAVGFTVPCEEHQPLEECKEKK